MAIDIGKEFLLKVKDPNSGIGKPDSPYSSIGGFISAILPNVYIIASLILFILMVGGGIAFLFASNDPQKKGQGAKMIGSAALGFVIIFISFWIIKLIEFSTGIDIFNSGV